MKRSIAFSLLLLFACHEALASNSCHIEKTRSDNKNLLEKKWSQASPLAGGNSGAKIYKTLDNDGNQFVIRDISHRRYKDKKREILSLLIASTNKYGPQLYAYDLKSGKIVMSFLENITTNPNSYKSIADLAHALKTMHNGPKFCPHPSIIEQTKNIHKSIGQYPQGIDYKKIEAILKELDTIKPFPKSSTHRDLCPNNIFFTKDGVKFIDFENSGLDDPFIDIATITVAYGYDTTTENKFLEIYLARKPSEEEIKHLQLMKKAALLFHGLSWLAKLPKNKRSNKNTKQDLPILKNLLDDLFAGKIDVTQDENVRIIASVLIKSALQ